MFGVRTHDHNIANELCPFHHPCLSFEDIRLSLTLNSELEIRYFTIVPATFLIFLSLMQSVML